MQKAPQRSNAAMRQSQPQQCPHIVSVKFMLFSSLCLHYVYSSFPLCLFSHIRFQNLFPYLSIFYQYLRYSTISASLPSSSYPAVRHHFIDGSTAHRCQITTLQLCQMLRNIFPFTAADAKTLRCTVQKLPFQILMAFRGLISEGPDHYILIIRHLILCPWPVFREDFPPVLHCACRSSVT